MISDIEVDMQKLLQHVTEIELAAQDLLEERRSIVNLDMKRNQTREARTAIKGKLTNFNPALDSKKTWMCFGNTFIKMRDDAVVKVLDKSYVETDNEIRSARDRLKVKLNKVREAEGKSEAEGFNLQALNKEEVQAIKSVL